MRCNLPSATGQHSPSEKQEPGLEGFSRNHTEQLARKPVLIGHLYLLFYDRNLSSLSAVPEKPILSQGVHF